MIKRIRKIAMSIFIILGLLAFNSYAQTQTIYHLDVKQSRLFWKGTKTIGTKHYGYLLFNSGLLRTNSNGMLSDGTFSINMNSIKNTEKISQKDNQRIEEELKGDSFFEVSTYPTTTIVIKSIFPTVHPSQFKVEGNLTIKKTTHPITFLATIKQSATQLTANANLTIDRAKWGIHQSKPASLSDQLFSGIKDKMISDEIPIALRLIFVKSPSK